MFQEDGALNRLNRLVRRGYVPDFEMEDLGDAVWLTHLADGPKLYLFTDGTIVAPDGDAINPTGEEKDRIFCEDKANLAEFKRFAGTLARPTWRQRTAPIRERYIYQPGCTILFLGGLWLAAYLAIEFLKTIFN